ncbi:helix-turn-helix domain-containing protein [Citrobacter werkmanii]|uniref:helix-turn-helix domain-containing protein n=1 Tax=Citrobacter sp. Cm046 TaxID=2985118 RepID=UPI0018FF682D|nr:MULTISPECIES: helix-turn-helix domain-containing protein [Citrobacter]MBJ9597314.1 helix-turn-helix domain-containing protein [Citrobacter werkmanii]MBJ9871441.1 helix-turn-helix domain-containing protein [Citrobacter werkmanii]MDM2930386.1 helix-turn-helix domain-containing protein [Citrobacter sp. Cm046]HEB0856378.1 helix-turn-helix domain-containing protein [Citrobacter freundii]
MPHFTDEFHLLYASQVSSLIGELSLFGVTKKIKREEIIRFSQPGRSVVLLISGFFSIYHMQDNLFIAYQSPQSIFGLLGLVTDVDSIYLKAETDAEIVLVDVDVVREKVEEKKLWKAVAINLVHMLALAIHRDSKTLNKTTYQRVCLSILEYEKLPSEIKKRVVLSKYIITRTTLSRSLVMSILARLAKEGRVMIKRGRLLYVDSCLAKLRECRH